MNNVQFGGGFTLDDLSPEAPITQSRAARLALAHLTDDPLLAGTVFAELSSDPAGHQVAYTNLVIALTAGLAESWTRDMDDPQVVIDFVRAQLAALEAEEH